ncbi:MAG: twin-arginine translocation signal domain-containing protein, partial [Chlamydiota bacterium]
NMAEKQMSRRRFLKLGATVVGAAAVGAVVPKPDAASAEAAKIVAEEGKAQAAAEVAEIGIAVPSETLKQEKVTKMEKFGNKEYEVPADLIKTKLLEGNDGNQYLFGITGGKLAYWNLKDGSQPDIGQKTEIIATTEFAVAVNSYALKEKNVSGIELLVRKKIIDTNEENIYWMESPESPFLFRIGYSGKNPKEMTLVMAETMGTEGKQLVRAFTGLKDVGDVGQEKTLAYFGVQDGSLLWPIIGVEEETQMQQQLEAEDRAEIVLKNGNKLSFAKDIDGKTLVEVLPEAENSQQFNYFSEAALSNEESFGIQVLFEDDNFYFINCQDDPLRNPYKTWWYRPAVLSNSEGKNEVLLDAISTSLAFYNKPGDANKAWMYKSRNGKKGDQYEGVVTVVYEQNGELWATTVATKMAAAEEPGTQVKIKKTLNMGKEKIKPSDENIKFIVRISEDYETKTDEVKSDNGRIKTQTQTPNGYIWPSLLDLQLGIVLTKDVLTGKVMFTGKESREDYTNHIIVTEGNQVTEYTYRFPFRTLDNGERLISREIALLDGMAVEMEIKPVEGNLSLFMTRDHIAGEQRVRKLLTSYLETWQKTLLPIVTN